MTADTSLCSVCPLRSEAASRDIDRILLSHSAHELGHRLWSEGRHDEATRFLTMASRYDDAGAQHDLIELEYTQGRKIANCAGLEPRPREAVWSRLVYQARCAAWLKLPKRPLTVIRGAAFAAALALAAIAGFAWNTPSALPTTGPSAQSVGLLTVPGNWATVPVKQAVPLSLAPPSTNSAQASASPSPSRATHTPAPTPSASPLIGPYVSVDKVDEDGNKLTAVAPANGSGSQPRIQLRADPGTQFSATLWSSGTQDCTWRFIGQSDPGSDPEQQKDTSSIPVDAGTRKAVLIPVHDWPVLTVEVSSGSSPDTCIMLGYKFLPLESAEVQPTPTPTPTSSMTPTSAMPEPSTLPSLR